MCIRDRYSSLHPSVDLQITKNITYVSTHIKRLDCSTWLSVSHFCLLQSQPRWYHMWVHHKKKMQKSTCRGMWHILENDTIFSHNYITFFCTYSISTNHNFCQNFIHTSVMLCSKQKFWGPYSEKNGTYMWQILCARFAYPAFNTVSVCIGTQFTVY